MYRRIIVPLEERTGTGSLDRARSLARRLGSTLELVHVHRLQEAPTELEALPQYRFQNVVERWDERDADAEVEEAAWLGERARELGVAEPDLRISSRVIHAPVARGLAAEGEAVLVVAEARTTRVAEMDDATRELIRGGDVPVLLVPPDSSEEPTVRHILVALDGSRFSEEVLGPALELAAATGASVTLLEVVPSRNGLSRFFHSTDRSAEAAWQFLDGVKERIPRRYGPIGVRAVRGEDPATEIVAEADRSAADIIAMATHGRGGVLRAILGSVAERVVAAAGRPVLVYRPTHTHASLDAVLSAAGAEPV